MRKLIKLLAAFLLLLTISCEEEENSNPYSFPLADAQNINSTELANAYLKAQEISGLKSLLVSRNGVTVSEAYFTEKGADDLYDVRSVTKSVISNLIGIAIEEGFIESIDQTLVEFLSPLGYTLEGNKALITIEDLLTMSAGFEWNEFTSGYSYSAWVSSNDQIEYCITGDLVSMPGEIFGYSSEESHLLSVILTEATGMSTHDFAFEYLFKHLGMSDEDFSWGAFPQGYFSGGADLSLKPKDMIKLGNLYLNGGNFDGKQLIPSDWIEESTSFKISTGMGGYVPDYGYLFWMNNSNQHKFFCANGYGGQLIVVFPNLELVIVTTSEWRLPTNEAGSQWVKVMSLVQNEVLNSVD